MAAYTALGRSSSDFPQGFWTDKASLSVTARDLRVAPFYARAYLRHQGQRA